MQFNSMRGSLLLSFHMAGVEGVTLKFCKHCENALTTKEEIHWGICKECGARMANQNQPILSQYRLLR